MYRGRERVFSGVPNGVLVAEASDLAPGQALDVGCGEGADALWLARRGWRVTAVDISRTALQRAAATAGLDLDLAGRVAWTRADLTDTPLPAGAFDLVSIQYFPLRRRPGHAVLCRLLAAVAPGGTLLFASHDAADLSARPGFDPADYYRRDEIAGLLGQDWTVLVNETRPRTAPAPEGTRHTRDAVLRAQRATALGDNGHRRTEER